MHSIEVVRIQEYDPNGVSRHYELRGAVYNFETKK